MTYYFLVRVDGDRREGPIGVVASSVEAAIEGAKEYLRESKFIGYAIPQIVSCERIGEVTITHPRN